MAERGLIGVLLVMASVGVAACPLCGNWQGSMQPLGSAYRQRVASAPPGTDAIPSESPAATPSATPALYRLDRDVAAIAVLALPIERGARLEIVDVIQGDVSMGSTIDSAWVDRLDRSAASKKPLLLIRARKWQAWDNLGPIGTERVGWLRQLVSSKPTAAMTDTEWQELAALVLPYLENPEPLVAELAYSELASAPYSAMRSLNTQVDAAALRQWIADPQLTKRQALYTLLLGVAGDASDTARIEERLDAAWKAKDATNLGPMLAADLELRGPSRMAWIDAKYIGDSERTTEELQAALLALSVQGGANNTIPRQRVIDSYRMFIEVHKPIAGFVAQDLATWNYWDAGPEYVALLRSGVGQNPASRYAMLNYLKQSPRADARAVVSASAIAK